MKREVIADKRICAKRVHMLNVLDEAVRLSEPKLKLMLQWFR